MNSKYGKIVHWMLFLTFLVIAYTCIMNTTFFSKEEIMSTFDFSFPILDIYDLGAADKLFIARIERRLGWVWHFWAGVIAFVLVLSLFIHNLKNKEMKMSKGKITLYGFSLIMFLSGLPLYIRTFINIPQKYQDIARFIHHYSAFIVGAIIIAHIIMVVYKENKNGTSKISNMLKFNSSALSIILLTSSLLLVGTTKLSADEKIDHYKIGMAFLKGDKGATIKTQVMPNCPYDFCKNGDIMKKKMGVEDKLDGTNIVKIKEVDLKKALYFFEKSAFEDNNKDGLDRALKILLGELDYKDKVFDPYLIKSLKKNLDITPDEYKIIVKNVLNKAEELKGCYSKYKLAEFKEYGYLDIFKGKEEESKGDYEKVTHNCPNGSFEYTIAINKI